MPEANKSPKGMGKSIMSNVNVKTAKTRKPRVVSNVSEIEVYYKRNVPYSSLPKLTSSKMAEAYFKKFWGRKKMDLVERFMVLYINRANRVMGWSRISQGGLNGTVADPKTIFQIALKANASSIILAHNHPSGNCVPSEADNRLTEKLKKAGEFLDLPILDHLILTSETYYSFADENTL